MNLPLMTISQLRAARYNLGTRVVYLTRHNKPLGKESQRAVESLRRQIAEVEAEIEQRQRERWL